MNKLTHRKTEAFTLVELLIAAAIGAALIAAAVMGFGVISQLPMRQGTTNVRLPDGTIANFYGTNSSFLTLGANPNYFQSAQARRMKDRLLSDVAASSAVFCLGRNTSGNPTLRPHQLTIGQTDFRNVATPAGFRNFLVGIDGDLESVFPEEQNGALSGLTNATIYAIGTLSSILNYSNNLAIIATYEVDFVPTLDPPGGTFASVRRYSGTNNTVPTDYYHVYYPSEDNGNNGFRPLGAFFGREDAAEDDDPFAVAVNQPFTFVWWPDPLVPRLGGNIIPSGSPESARDNYSNMADRTSLFFVLPAFPSL
jgi:hypothetical protein